MSVTDTHVIGDYTAAITIDGATHFLLIQPGGASTAYKKISRNVLLGVTGQPMDISTSQNVTNKTLDNSNILTLRDDRFTLQDNVDTTKQAQFQLSGITTATTRTYVLPNRSDTLVDLGSTQTLTSKTLTSPIITGGSVTGTTITTDAIVGQSVANSGTVYGMSITSAKVGTNGVVTTSITDSAVTPAKLLTGTGSSWTWQSWTPTWTNVSGGTTTFAKYTQIGKTIIFRVKYTLAGANVSGAIIFSTPTSINSDLTTSLTDIVTSSAMLTDTSAGFYFPSTVVWQSSTTLGIYPSSASGTYMSLVTASSTVPFTWATTDVIEAWGIYEAA